MERMLLCYPMVSYSVRLKNGGMIMGKNDRNKDTLGFTEKLCWSLGMSTGRQFITALVSTYILVFLTDVFGIAAAAAGVIMTFATIWDAVNDPIMGTLSDKTKSRWGKYRPYLLFVPIPLAIVSVLLFAAPSLTASGKVIYTAVLYICYGMLVTCIEIPYNALLPAMTKNEMERNDTISMYTFIASVIILIVTSFTPNLVAVLGGEDTSKGYMMLVGIGAVCMIVTSWTAFIKCKERYTVESNREVSAGRRLAALFRVREMYPLILFWCVGCILFALIMSSSIYYCMYYLMNPGLIATYMLTINIAGMLGIMVVMPVMIRLLKGNIKRTITITQSISAVCLLVCFLTAGKSLTVIYVFTFIGCMFATMTNAFRPMTVFGMTDYVRDKSGLMLNGTISAIGGFSFKCGTAISGAILAGVLAATGYIANAIGQEPAAFMTGINATRFLIPLIATILYIILAQFYPEKQIGEILARERAVKAEELTEAGTVREAAGSLV
jgi:sugar (glycoside-pentoside-hexuronide) transporter